MLAWRMDARDAAQRLDALVYNDILTEGHPEKASLWKHATVEHRREGASGSDTFHTLNRE